MPTNCPQRLRLTRAQEGRKINKALVLDSFVATQPGEPLVAIWPQAVMNPEQQAEAAETVQSHCGLSAGAGRAGVARLAPGRVWQRLVASGWQPSGG